MKQINIMNEKGIDVSAILLMTFCVEEYSHEYAIFGIAKKSNYSIHVMRVNDINKDETEFSEIDDLKEKQQITFTAKKIIGGGL